MATARIFLIVCSSILPFLLLLLPLPADGSLGPGTAHQEKEDPAHYHRDSMDDYYASRKSSGTPYRNPWETKTGLKHLQRALTDFHLLSKDHVRSLRKTINRRSTQRNILHISFDALNKTFNLELERDFGRFLFPIEAVIVSNDGSERPFDWCPECYYKGSINSVAGSVAVVFYYEGVLTGRLEFQGRTYRIESASRYFHESENIHMVVYDVASMVDPLHLDGRNSSGHTFCGASHEHTLHFLAKELNNTDGRSHASSPLHSQAQNKPQQQVKGSRSRRTLPTPTNNACVVAVVADSVFYAAHQSSAAIVTNSMLDHIAFASAIFQRTTFDTYTNLILAVKRVKIYDSQGSDPYYAASWDVNDLLTKFSHTESFSDVCVAHLFTHYDFTGGTLGLAWVASSDPSRAGGICHTGVGQWLNTGLTTDISFGSLIPTEMAHLVTTHEVGHNWGSPHDTTSECTNDANGRFIMFPTAVDGSRPNNDDFSTCSRSSIAPVLSSKANCFSIPPEGICGNGKREPKGPDGVLGNTDDEECDAGPGDACCNSSCKLKSGAQCSDFNNPCCSSCKANSSIVCFNAFENDAFCRATTTCTIPSGGTSNDITCPDPGSKPAGEKCANAGSCDGLAHSSSIKDRCLSYCLKYGAEACTCSGSNECRVCCRHSDSLTAGCNTPFKNFTNLDGSYKCMPAYTVVKKENTIVGNADCWAHDVTNTSVTRYQDDPKQNFDCVDTASSPCQKILSLDPGTACSIGQCGKDSVCKAQDTTTAKFWNSLETLSVDSIKRWMKENIVGAVIILVFIAYLPLAIIVHRRDKRIKQEKEERYKKMKAKRVAKANERQNRDQPRNERRQEKPRNGNNNNNNNNNNNKASNGNGRSSNLNNNNIKSNQGNVQPVMIKPNQRPIPPSQYEQQQGGLTNLNERPRLRSYNDPRFV